MLRICAKLFFHRHCNRGQSALLNRRYRGASSTAVRNSCLGYRTLTFCIVCIASIYTLNLLLRRQRFDRSRLMYVAIPPSRTPWAQRFPPSKAFLPCLAAYTRCKWLVPPPKKKTCGYSSQGGNSHDSAARKKGAFVS